MKSEHTYTVGDKVHAVNFKSGNLQEWVKRLGEDRVLYFLHSWSAAHSGQSWFKAQIAKAKDVPGEDASDKAKDDWQKIVDKLSQVRRGEYIDLIALMPKEREEREWTEVLLDKVRKARKADGNDGAKKVKDEYFNTIADETERASKLEEYTSFLMSLG